MSKQNDAKIIMKIGENIKKLYHFEIFPRSQLSRFETDIGRLSGGTNPNILARASAEKKN